MDRKVLADPAVAGYVNERFVPLRIDVTVAASAELRKRYGLGQEAPVFLFLKPDGQELDRQRGELTCEEFLGLLRDVVAGKHFAALEERAAKGADGYEFLLAYGLRLHGRCAPEAAEVLRRAVALDPEAKRTATIDAQYLLACLECGDQRAEALAAFAAAHPKSPHTVKAHQTLTMLYGAASLDKAIASYEFLRTHGALDPPWRKHAYARLLAWSGRDVEIGLALVTEALRAAPDEPRWLDTKAECLSRLGRYGEAIEIEERALAKAQRLEERAEFERALYELRKRAAEARR